jgi:predicted TIM-barrel fold metal-dependent hydrolase
VKVIDADTHLYEGRGLWAEHTAPRERDLALRIADDELGHAWLVLGDRRIHLAEVHHPGDVSSMGVYRERVRAGLPAERPYDEALPRHFWDPVMRRDRLDEMGLDEAVVFPNFGLLWERPLASDLPATRVNMAAWNRWAVAVAQEGQGRLHPVAHLGLRDRSFLEDQLRLMAAGDLRLAMIAPALVDGRPLSHPDLDWAWSAFEEHGVTPVFHVANFPHPFHDGWYAGDPDEVAPVLSSAFIWTPPALALADLAVNGVLARHPDLRVGVMELSAVWVPMFLLMLDGGFDFHARFNGRPLHDLELRPSEYIRRQVRVAAFGYERPDRLIGQAGELFMFCSDFPHAEGLAQPLEDYRGLCGPVEEAAADRLYGGNVAWLLDAAPS